MNFIKEYFMNRKIFNRRNLACLFALSALSACGGTGTGNPVITIQSNPLAGPSSGAIEKRAPTYALLMDRLFRGFGEFLGVRPAQAAVSSFAVFRMCNDTMVFKDANGTVIPFSSTTSPEVGQGLLDFSPTSQNPMTIGSLAIPVGTEISEINITFAVVPSVCSGANYGVQFDNGVGGGLKNITQNTAFKFLFTAGNLQVTSSTQTITLLFGNIVDGMAALGAGLDNTTIQTVNVGQAR